MRDWIGDLQISLRNLRKQKAYTVAAVVALALGIGGVATVFSVINTVLLSPSPFPEPERLYLVRQSIPKAGSQLTIAPCLYEQLRESGRGIEGLAAFDRIFFHLSSEGEPERLPGAQISVNFFGVLGIEPVLGRGFTSEEDTPGANRSVVLSHGLWQSRFGGDENVLGRVLEVDVVQSFGPDREIPERLTVVGVLPADFRFPFGPLDLWVPLAPSREGPAWRFALLFLLGRLSPDVPIDRALADFNASFQSLNFDDSLPEENRTLNLTALTELGVQDVRSDLFLLWAASALVLLIACANVAHLLMARAAAREGELALRVVIGAGRWKLVRLLLTESLCLAALGAAVGLVLSKAALSLLRAYGPGNVPRLTEVELEPRVLAFTCLLAVLTTLIFGVIPAWKGSRVELCQVLKDVGRVPGQGRSRLSLRGLLVAFETALSLVLLISATLVVTSLYRLQDVEPGYQPDNVLTFRAQLPSKRYPERSQRNAVMRELLVRYASVPGVVSSGLINHLPLGNVHVAMSYRVVGQGEPDAFHRASARFVSENYFETMEIPLLRGRSFEEKDVADRSKVVVVNQKLAAERWPNGDPLGERLVLRGEDGSGLEVIGVVGDVHQRGLVQEIEPALYVPILPSPSASFVVRTASEPSSMFDLLKRETAEVAPHLSLFSVSTLRDSLDGSLAPERFQTTLMMIFAGIAVALAVVGVYSVMAYSVAYRRHEIGVRMAMGARGADVVKMILRQASVPTLLGTGLGLLSAFQLTEFLESMLFGVSPREPAVFVAAALVLVLVAFIAAWAPARRAARVDPQVILRER